MEKFEELFIFLFHVNFLKICQTDLFILYSEKVTMLLSLFRLSKKIHQWWKTTTLTVAGTAVSTEAGTQLQPFIRRGKEGHSVCPDVDAWLKRNACQR